MKHFKGNLIAISIVISINGLFSFTSPNILEEEFFTLGAENFAYCSSSSSAPWNYYISGVSLENINNTNQSNPKSYPYGDYTNLSTSLSSGSAYTIAVTTKLTNWDPHNTKTAYLYGWIDYDQNEVFDDPGELAFSTAIIITAGSGESAYTSNETINVPSGLSNVTGTRLRIIVEYNNIPTPCETGFTGEVEDYTIDIQSGGGGSNNSSGGEIVWEEIPIDVTIIGNDYKKPYNYSATPIMACNQIDNGDAGWVEFEILEDLTDNNNDDWYYVGLIDETVAVGDTGTQDLDFALRALDDEVYVLESGTLKGGLGGVTSGGTVGEKYRIEKDANGTITYLKDGTTFYTSATNTGSLNLRPVLYLYVTDSDGKIPIKITSSANCDELIIRHAKSDIYGNNLGGVDLTPEGATIPYSFNWSNGASSEDLINLNTVGEYLVTITDSSTPSKTANDTIDIYQMFDISWDDQDMIQSGLTQSGLTYNQPGSSFFQRIESCNDMIVANSSGVIELTLPNGLYAGQNDTNTILFGFIEENAPTNFFDNNGNGFYGMRLESNPQSGISYGLYKDNVILINPDLNFYIGSDTKFTVQIKNGEILFQKNGKDFYKFSNLSLGVPI